MKKYFINSLCLLIVLAVISCESEQAKKERLAREEKQRIELREQKEKEIKIEKAVALRLEQIRIEKEKQAEIDRIEQEKQAEADRIEQEKQAEIDRIAREEKEKKEQKEKEIYDKYINNSLPTGATPYARHFGRNPSCSDYGCSTVKVTTSNSDVLVTIKKKERVVRHAYISSGDSYAFSFPNGTYQVFFYYGRGWNPIKEMKNGKIKGGFVSDESFGKDSPQYLDNNTLEYSLVLQRNGNFSTSPSDPEEAL